MTKVVLDLGDCDAANVQAGGGARAQRLESRAEVIVRGGLGLGASRKCPSVSRSSGSSLLHASGLRCPAVHRDPDLRHTRATLSPPQPVGHRSQIWSPSSPFSISSIPSRPGLCHFAHLVTQFPLPPSTLLPFTRPPYTAAKRALKKGTQHVLPRFQSHQQVPTLSP